MTRGASDLAIRIAPRKPIELVTAKCPACKRTAEVPTGSRAWCTECKKLMRLAE